MQSKYNEVKEKLDASQQEAIVEEAHDKVRLEVFCKLLEESGVDFEGHGVKAECGRFANYIAGLPLSTCSNYMSNRDLNTSKHCEEVLKVNSTLKQVGIKWQL